MWHYLQKRNRTQTPGFTIVELLIVVVVIAILAAITIVAYNGITKQATESVLKSDLQQVSTQLGMVKAEDGAYPDSDSGLKVSSGTNLQYTKTSDDVFCATVQAKGQSFYLNSASGNIEAGQCGTHTPPAVGGGGGSTPTTMQTFTQSACSALAVYTGSNPAALLNLTDSRGGTTRTYTVGKLADNKCWMLDNLKLGSTTGTITLTPTDSNVASNFTLPQLYSGTSSTERSFDTPKIYGPVPGDTGAGTTNYGYLYNWPAATAGETMTSHPQTAGNAPNSICPKNWRLPTGNSTGEFAWLNAKMNNPSATSPSTANGSGYYQNWNFTGPFRGALSGDWWAGFGVQGGNGYLWSASAYPDDPDSAFSAYFDPSFVRPGDVFNDRYLGLGVRCLLN